VDRDTSVSRTPTVALGSLARERAFLRERRARGPQKLLGPPTARVNRAVRGSCEDAEAADAWRPCSWRDEMAGDAVVPEASNVMMARRFAAERCANASVPALGFDATAPAAPLKQSLLETSGTSPSSSSATSSSTTPKLMDPSASSAAAETSSGAKHRGRPPGSRNKEKVPARWTPGAGGPLRLGAPMRGTANRAAPGTSSALTLRGPAPGGALNAPSPLAAAPTPRALRSIDRVLREVEAALGLLPPLADAPGP
jgi:hypothetical protein